MILYKSNWLQKLSTKMILWQSMQNCVKLKNHRAYTSKYEKEKLYLKYCATFFVTNEKHSHLKKLFILIAII